MEFKEPKEIFDFSVKAPGFKEGQKLQINKEEYVCKNGIPRSIEMLSAAQKQTEETFGFKWKKRSTFDSKESLSKMRNWLIDKYGNSADFTWLESYQEKPILLDAGCGAGMSGLELFGPILSNIDYLGIDVSESVDTAKERFAERGHTAAFMQADVCNLPFPESSIDIIFSEGVLHHTDSTQHALFALAKLLRPGGRFLFYVYKLKGAVREFTDDYIRDKLQVMPPQEAWDAMEPLTKLGIALGELDIEIDIPQDIELLDIPAGKINVQRLFYWHVAKMFYSPELSFDAMNHINYDWYAPRNAHRQSVHDVRKWCAKAGMEIEREVVEDAGITVIARKE